ncbi:hypothetical protein TrLO_g14068 [Triparma laevis f. longispina]|uniref:Calpain catalytic domain-containing protein n=1 Tax=Triparma laevis f. longispina TaxID=1714387 RepID=A0A9W7C6M4_9STRA|nr:hypothetical protein TrLO_g14068 [Triparma laevis f. longispina]
MSDEDEIIMRLETQGAKYFVDMDFPTSDDSLYRLKSQPPPYANPNVAWLRPHEFEDDNDYFKDTGKTGDVKVGGLNTNYLASALAMLASSPLPFVENLFGSGVNDYKKYGIYTCRFYKNGNWADVICDTRLPCNVEETADGVLSELCYTSCADKREVFVPFVEKAYAKLHGTYESLNKGSISEALVDLTGASCDKINLTSEKVHSSVNSGYLWDELVSFHTKQFVMGCSISDSEATSEAGEKTKGLLTNVAYPVVDVREVQSSTGIVKFVKFRNPWGKGGWEGDWGAGSSKWDDYPEVQAELKVDDMDLDGDPKATFWMNFTDLSLLFTKLYVCRTFPDEMGWRQYCCTGDWVGKTAGGAPIKNMQAGAGKKLGEEEKPETDKNGKGVTSIASALKSHANVRPESDPFWFNNPQFQLRVTTKTRVHISLTQQDRRIRSQLRENYPIAFEVVKTKRIVADLNKDHPRIWDLGGSGSGSGGGEELACESIKNFYSSHLPQREVSVCDFDLDPNYVYNIIPHPVQRMREGKFFLRVFSDKDILLEQIGDTSSLYLPGSWDKINDCDTSGGPLRSFDEKNKKGKDNPRWCQNPQFVLTTAKPRSAHDDEDEDAPKSVDIKIVVRRTDSGKKASKSRTSRDDRKGSSMTGVEKKQPFVGVNVCRAPMSEKDIKVASQRRRQQDAKINALGVRLPTKESSLKAQRRKMAAAQKAAEEGDEDGDEIHDSLGTGPTDNKTVSTGSITDRKMTINKEEWSISTDYTSKDVTSIFMKKVDVETLSDGLLIVPTLSEKGAKGGFTLEIHTDYPVKVNELPEARSKTLTGEWTETTAGGSHLNPDWKKNPKYQLKLHSSEAANVKIMLSRNESSWSKECTKDSIGAMMGFYIMLGDKPNRDMGNIYHDGKPWNESAFVPLHSVTTPDNFMLPPLQDDECYTIMPCTFDGGKKGSFFLSVVSEVGFGLSVKGGEGGKKDLGGGGGRRQTKLGRID